MSTEKRDRWDAVDDGSMTRYEVADLIGTSPEYVSYLRSSWVSEWKADLEDVTHRRCARCKFTADERNPIIKGSGGMCLACYLLVHRIDPVDFYENERLWKSVVPWRPGSESNSDPRMRVFELLRRDLERKIGEEDPREFAHRRGEDPQKLAFFLSRRAQGAASEMMEMVARLLGIRPPMAKAIGDKYDIPGRLIAHIVRGW